MVLAQLAAVVGTLACLSAGASNLYGQTESDLALAPGPDVVVGDLQETQRWGANPGGDIQAYSVATMSCNIGDTPLLWHSSDNRHPVIGQNMFRLKAGRFEQIGQSWLKWAFAALNENFCAQCVDPGTSSLLGVNCSDPYSGSLNGSQSRLGPKSVVNPFTGAFPQSHATPGTATIAGRLQVHTVDVDPNDNAGALYFLEGQYVSPDDSAAGNLYNNASYRQVWITTGYNLTYTGPFGRTSATARERPAITAWQQEDPLVALTLVNVPGDGRLYVGFRATLLGGVRWHYEFAVQNLNSDRAVGGVLFPLPPGATVNNLGFHDVDYHSGEPYDATDWTATVDSAGVHWDTVDHATNPNANALRWGTLYNFRFDADVGPPDVAAADLTLFKPGAPTSVQVQIAQPAVQTGDLNCDGSVNFRDINPFVQAITDPLGWEAAHAGCNILNADSNGDGQIGFADINPFVALLSGARDAADPHLFR